MRVGPRVAADAPKGRPVAPPPKQCRHCSTQSETFAESCPSCGRSYGSSPGVIAAAIAAACVAVILLLGGCAVLFGLAVEKAGEELEDVGITRSQFNAVEPGASEASVRAQLGRPISTEELSTPGVKCIYYPQSGEGIVGLDDFQFCFKDGVLSSKRLD